jgi:hypothetical protein
MNVIPPEGVTVVIENDTVTITNQTVDIDPAEEDEDEDDTGNGNTGEEDSPEEGGIKSVSSLCFPPT